MRSFIIALCLCLFASCKCCDAQMFRGRNYQNSYQPPAFNPNRKVDGATQYNSGRTAEFPQGANKLECWVVLSPNWRAIPLEKQIVDAVNRDPRMKLIKQNTRWNFYESSSPLFAESELIKKTGTATPIVVITAPDGRIMADGSGGMFMNAKSTPDSVGEIIDTMMDAIGRFNPPPVVQGQTEATPIIRESDMGLSTGTPGSPVWQLQGSLGPSAPEQCGPDGCPIPVSPVIDIPSDGEMSPVLPSRHPDHTLIAAGGALAVAAAAIFLGIKTPGVNKK